MKKKIVMALGAAMMMSAAVLPVWASDTDGGKADSLVMNVGADETEVYLNWYSVSGTDGVVQWAKKADLADNQSFPEEYREIPAVTKASSKNGYYSNKADITGLEANTEYVYRVGHDGGWSQTYEYSTENFDNNFEFLLVGDPQIGAGSTASDIVGWKATMQQAEESFPNASFLISAGDQVNTNNNETQYEGYLSPEQMSSLPSAVNVGNHDNGKTNYSEHFTVPNESEKGEVAATGDQSGDYWYMYGDVLFMSINSNNLSTAEHEAFLKEALAEKGDQAKWKIVTFHHSVYSTASHTNDKDILQRRSELPPIFSELGIDAVLMGHDHVYTRSYMMQGTNPVGADQGPQSSVTNPEKGEVLYLTANSASGSKYYSIKNLDFPFSAVMDQKNRPNITDVKVTDDSLTFTTYYTDTMEVLDSFTIQREEVPPTLQVPEETQILVGASFDPMEGVTAQDYQDGDLTKAVTVEGTVDTSRAGAYTLRYSVTDKAGNTVTASRIVRVKADTEILEKQIDVLENLNPSDYTSKSWSAFAAALENAKNIAEDPMSQQEQVDKAYEALILSWDGLVYGNCTAAAEVALQEAEAILANDTGAYQSEGIENLRKMSNYLKGILALGEEATQKDINEATVNVLDALIHLTDMVDASRLENLIELAKTLTEQEDKYSASSMEALKAALEEAKAVIADEGRTQTEVSDAYKAVANAIAGLEVKGDKAAMKSVLDMAENILNHGQDYIQSSLEGLQEAYDAAKSVYDDVDASQSEINDATRKLTQEVAGVRLLGDVNGDQKIDTTDVQMLLRACSEAGELGDADLEAADVNGDGKANTADAALLIKYTAELISNF